MTVSVVTVLIETHGKQDFLFATGKRRESVGASQLVREVSGWAVEQLTDPDGTITGGADAEVLVRGSGMFLGFFRDPDAARRVVTAVTLRALIEAPGLAVTGVVGEPFGWDSGAAPARVRAAFTEMADVRASVPAPVARFLVLPVTALCPSSALPAAELVLVGTEWELRSAVSSAKSRAAERAWRRLAEDSGLSVDAVREAIVRLEGDEPDSPPRVAIVHADGNGLGAVLAGLDDVLVKPADLTPDTNYAAGYRAFSTALDEVLHTAFRDAVTAVSAGLDREVDVLPLVLGGDDLAFVADGAVAADLTRHFLASFVRHAANRPQLAGPVLVQTGDSRLGISAGLVIVGPHFPFAVAYRLADDLLNGLAKAASDRLVDRVGNSVPAISLAAHVHLDSAAVAVDALLDGLTVAGALLTAAPYVQIVDVETVPTRELSDESVAWLAGRELDKLWALAAALRERDDAGHFMRPSAQLHHLRARLRPDPRAAEEYLTRLYQADRSRWEPLVPLRTIHLEGPDTVMLLDAIALAPFLLGPPDSASGAEVAHA